MLSVPTNMMLENVQQQAMHDIELKSKDPIYIKQFRIPEAQRQAVDVEKLLKLGVICPLRS